jgi:pyruvate kinase
MRRVKIVCTLGSATDSYERVKALVEAGMDVARFAFGHGGHGTHGVLRGCEEYGEHEERYRLVRKAADETGRSVGVLADLQGPVAAARPVRPSPTGHRAHRSPAAPLAQPSPVAPSRLSPRDEADLRWAVRTGFDIVALSFVRDGRDVEAVHRVMDEEGRRLPVLAKVETPQAVASIEDIVAAFDGIMVARGDLGVELPLEQVPLVQKRVVELARRNAKPVVVATQMLDSMIENVRPTRAEVSDVANAVLDGTDAVMLSGETSVGRHPVGTVATMARIVEAAEEGLLAAGLAPLTERTKPRTQGGAVARAAAEAGDFLGARFLVAFTQSGDTARRLARYRSPIPVLAFTAEQATRSRLSLTWGVETFLVPAAGSTDAMVRQVDEALLRCGRCRRGDLVVVTAGSPPGVAGTTNMVRVHRVGEDDGVVR